MRRVLRIGALVIAGAVLIAVLDHYQYTIVTAWERKNFPVPADPSVPPLGREILKERRGQRINEVSREYGRIRVKLDRARAKGYPVGALEPKMTTAMNAARAGRYEQALTLLNLIEVRIPRPGERVVPASKGDPVVDEPEKPIKARPVRKAARKKRAGAR